MSEFSIEKKSRDQFEGEMVNSFEQKIATMGSQGLLGLEIDVIQVNLGFLCNQQCRHCHLEASRSHNEIMEWPTMELTIEAARNARCRLVDLTGGAPELNPHFRRFVETLHKEGHSVQVRTNLTVLLEPGMETMPDFFRANEVQIVGSMPCYQEENVRAQRGPGVYEKSIEAIRRLNRLGYGSDEKLTLNLVYNPGGSFLPPDQTKLESDYRRELAKRFGISFSQLLTITNMPIGRFRADLRKQNKECEYQQLLEDAYNPEILDGLMCRHQLSVGWDGTLYDCDFNLALRLPVNYGAPDHIDRFDISMLTTRRIVTGQHCFGCTAGAGSSCSGALV